jgi:hypothetical protein
MCNRKINIFRSTWYKKRGKQVHANFLSILMKVKEELRKSLSVLQLSSITKQYCITVMVMPFMRNTCTMLQYWH